MSSHAPVLAIDFGTSYSAAVAYAGHEAVAIRHDGELQIPSVVYVPRCGDLEVGRAAVARALGDPLAAAFSLKRILGRAYSDPAVRSYESGCGAALRQGPGDQLHLSVRGTDFSPVQLVAALIGHLRARAEEQTGARFNHAIMTVPVGAPQSYLDALGRAAALGGLEVIEYVPEPTAGLLAYGFHRERCNRRIAVCDFGGGTLDVACIEQRGLHFASDVSDGDLYLGGDDFDRAIASAVAGLVYRQTQVDMTRDGLGWNHLLWCSESTKRLLSERQTARLHMAEAFAHGGQRRDLSVLIERKWMRERWAPLVDRARDVTGRMLRSAQWPVEACDEVVLIGGTTLIPQVQEQLSELFRRPVSTRPGAEIAVARGGAAFAAHLAERGRLPEPAPEPRARAQPDLACAG